MQKLPCGTSLAAAVALVACWGAWAEPAAEHVVIVGCDGLNPEAVEKADMPVLRGLMAEGAYTLHARAVMPTSSSSNWASMLMGAGPEQHGVTSNKWQRDSFEIAPTAAGPEGIFPTLFGVLRAQRPAAVIGVFYDWGGFGRLVEGKSADAFEHVPGPEATMARAVQFWKERKPTLLFIQLDHVDHAGHDRGWGSPEYFQAAALADKLTGDIVQAVRDSGLMDSTFILVTSDHGGNKKSHGGNTMGELEIPWVIAGPGVAKKKEIAGPVNVYDTAATVAQILGLDAPSCWIAKPVAEAFASDAQGR